MQYNLKYTATIFAANNQINKNKIKLQQKFWISGAYRNITIELNVKSTDTLLKKKIIQNYNKNINTLKENTRKKNYK